MWKKLLFALALLTIGSNFAQAQVATTLVPINNTTWTDLGAGPYQVYSNGTAVFAIGDTTPSLTGNVGFPIPASASLSVSTNSHVWAKATTAFATNAIVAPIVGLSGGGGGGGGVVTQGAQDATAAPWKMALYQGGSVLSAVNPIFTSPGTGAVFSMSAASAAFVDCAIVTVGCKNDAAWDGVAASPTLMAVNKRISNSAATPIQLRAARASVANVTDGTSIAAMGTGDGKTVVQLNATTDMQWRASVSGATATLTFPNSINASLKTYTTGIQCYREDAGTTNFHGTLNDTGASIVGMPSGGGTGGGMVASYLTPLVGSAINTSLIITLSVTGTTVYCSAQGYFGP